MAGKERQDIETAAQRETLQVSLEPLSSVKGDR